MLPTAVAMSRYRRSSRLPGPGLRLAMCALLLVASAGLLLFASSAVDAASESPWEFAGASVEDSGWAMPLEMNSMGVVNSMSQSHDASHMSDLQLFELQSTLTGTGLCAIVLTFVTETAPTITCCDPVSLPGLSISLDPDSVEGHNSVGMVVLELHVKNGSLVFGNVNGLTFNGDNGGVIAINTIITATLEDLNTALASLLFGPDSGFAGTAAIEWHLSNVGPVTATPSSGTYQVPVGAAVTTTDPDPTINANLQPNGLPIGVVRVSMLIQEEKAITIYNSTEFKAQLLKDLADILGILSSRMNVQALSAKLGGTITIIFDFLAPITSTTAQAAIIAVTQKMTNPSLAAPYTFMTTSDHTQMKTLAVQSSQKDSAFTTQAVATTTSQVLYDTLIAVDPTTPLVTDTTYMSLVDWTTISQLCDDSVYRQQCTTTDTSSSWASWVLPLIIAGCCLVGVCCFSAILFACIRYRRRSPEGELKLAPPPMEGISDGPAKKFVYSAPVSGTGEDSMSEVTLHPQGEEFEPSHHSISGEEPSKNRLSAKFPNKSPPGGEEVGAGAAEVSGRHFYYVDGQKHTSESSGSGERRLSKVGSQAHFTIEGSQSRDSSIHFTVESSRSGTEASRSASSGTTESRAHSTPHSPISSSGAASSGRSRASSIEEAKEPEKVMEKATTPHKAIEKAALPVLRPSVRSPKK